MMPPRRPALLGGGDGSGNPPAGLQGGLMCQLSGTGAGSAHRASVVRLRELPLQRCQQRGGGFAKWRRRLLRAWGGARGAAVAVVRPWRAAPLWKSSHR